MAFTKLYVTRADWHLTAFANKGSWDGQAAATLFKALTRKADDRSALGSAHAETSSGDWRGRLWKGITGPLSAQTISGTVNCVIQTSENNADADMHWYVHIWVTQGDTDAVRGTLVDNYSESAGVNEWPTTKTAIAFNAAIALSSLAIQAGDRIVAELGYIARNVIATSRTGTLYSGTGSFDSVYADATLGSTTNVANFLEFSNSISTPAAPANDDCANATALGGTVPQQVSVNNEWATEEAGDPQTTYAFWYTFGTVWYTFTPSITGSYIFDLSDSDVANIVGIFTGSCGSLTEVDSGENILSVALTASTTYYIMIGTWDGGGGNLVMRIDLGDVPANDDCADAETISSLPYEDVRYIHNATAEGSDPLPSAAAVAFRTVWWKWTAPANLDIEIDTIGSFYNTVLSVWTGTCGSFSEVTSNDDIGGGDQDSRVTFSAVSGTTYYICVSGRLSTSGDAVNTSRCELHVVSTTPITPPSNDNFADAELISAIPFDSGTFDGEGATMETESLSCGSLQKSVWYKWTAPNVMQVAAIMTLNGASGDTRVGVFTGASLGSLVEVACNASTGKAVFTTEAGVTYYIVAGISATSSAGSFDYRIQIRQALIPPRPVISESECEWILWVPAGPTPPADAHARVYIEWTHPGTNVLNFVIQRCLTEGCTSFSNFATLSSAARSQTIAASFTLPNELMRFRIAAVGTDGTSYSKIMTARRGDTLHPTVFSGLIESEWKDLNYLQTYEFSSFPGAITAGALSSIPEEGIILSVYAALCSADPWYNQNPAYPGPNQGAGHTWGLFARKPGDLPPNSFGEEQSGGYGWLAVNPDGCEEVFYHGFNSGSPQIPINGSTYTSEGGWVQQYPVTGERYTVDLLYQLQWGVYEWSYMTTPVPPWWVLPDEQWVQHYSGLRWSEIGAHITWVYPFTFEDSPESAEPDFEPPSAPPPSVTPNDFEGVPNGGSVDDTCPCEPGTGPVLPPTPYMPIPAWIASCDFGGVAPNGTDPTYAENWRL